MKYLIRPFTMHFYNDAMLLWQQSEGICLSTADERESIEKYLERNPGMSFIAMVENELVGVVLAGHDGRRGYIHHLAVYPDCQREGIGSKLLEYCLSALEKEGLRKCHIFIVNDNEQARAFWQKQGWAIRDDIQLLSYCLDEQECACESV